MTSSIRRTYEKILFFERIFVSTDRTSDIWTCPFILQWSPAEASEGNTVNGTCGEEIVRDAAASSAPAALQWDPVKSFFF